MKKKSLKEIEVKVKIGNVAEVKKTLEKLGVGWSKPKKQIDSYFRLKNQATATQKPGSYILRIRREDKASFTLKALTDRYGVWEEYETKIDDADELEKILLKIGFVEVLTLHKKRTSGKYGKFSLEVDEIKELGNYLEVEVRGQNGEKLQAEIKNLFLKVGLPEKNIERRGYPEIILGSRGLKFEGQS